MIMNGQEAVRQIDASLLPFLATRDEDESKRLCERLVFDTADQIIKAVINSELQVSFDRAQHNYYDSEQVQDAKDIYGDIIEKLLRRLQYLKTNSDSESIINFRSYVGVIARNSCYDYLRSKYPKRWRLKTQLRFALSHNEKFALWENEDEELICGLAEWWGNIKTIDRYEAMDQLVFSRNEINCSNPADLIAPIFEQLKTPLKLEALVGIVAELCGIKDSPKQEIKEEFYQIQSNQPDVATQVEQKLFLERLWNEICRLSVRQRTALLLNLRDADGYGISLFPYREIATIRQIAEALEIPYEEFARMWNDLPIDDATIASRLGIMRQQVINLRKVARERLAKFMKTQ
jgi:RNA polymerase sigma factor (sigma-70 family)